MPTAQSVRAEITVIHLGKWSRRLDTTKYSIIIISDTAVLCIYFGAMGNSRVGHRKANAHTERLRGTQEKPLLNGRRREPQPGSI